MPGKIVAIKKMDDIPEIYRDTPIGLLLEYNNLGRPFDAYKKACLLAAMCMDNREKLNIPNNFAFIIRLGGANLACCGFYMSYAIAVGKVRHMAVIAHNQCGMSDLASKKDIFVEGLVDVAGWRREDAIKHFEDSIPAHEIGDETEFTLKEVEKLRNIYPNVQVAPLFYDLTDGLLYDIVPEDRK